MVIMYKQLNKVWNIVVIQGKILRENNEREKNVLKLYNIEVVVYINTNRLIYYYKNEK